MFLDLHDNLLSWIVVDSFPCHQKSGNREELGFQCYKYLSLYLLDYAKI